MRKTKWLLYIALLLFAAWVSRMGYREVMLARAEKTRATDGWIQKKEIVRLMRYHGADGMKITRDEACIFRDSRWIVVVRRDRG